MRRSLGLGMVAVWCAVAAAGGCTPRMAKVEMHSAANPGPWRDVKVLTEVKDGKLTVAVENYPTLPSDRVRQFEVIDDRGVYVGERVFEAGEATRETFILSAESKYVTVLVRSTARGTWRSEPIGLPKSEPPKK